MSAQSESEMPKAKAGQACRRLPALDRQSSTVAMMSRPSTINGQIDAVVSSAPTTAAELASQARLTQSAGLLVLWTPGRHQTRMSQRDTDTSIPKSAS